MRQRDDKKQEALFLATIKVVNEIGFSTSSVTKIAKEAGVSPATLYVYFENKDDLLVSTYVEIKKSMGSAMLEGFDETLPIHDIFHRVWKNVCEYVMEHREEFRYTEQFSNSPYSKKADKLLIQQQFEPLLTIVRKGIEQKILKNIDMDMLGAFLIHPILVLANPNHCQTFELSDENIETAFCMAWDALRR